MFRLLGLVVVFGSSNFPFAYSVVHIASAFAGVVRWWSRRTRRILGRANFVGQLIVEAVRKVRATRANAFAKVRWRFRGGSGARETSAREGGAGFTPAQFWRADVADLAAARPEPIPVYAEMGSVNPAFILPGALARAFGGDCGRSACLATQGIGQFCTNPGLIVLQRSPAAEQFLQALTAKLTATPEGPMLTPGIRKSFGTNTRACAKQPGVKKLLVEARAVIACGAAPVWFETEAATFLKNHALAEEIFGPSSVVIWCRDRGALLEIARHIEGGLTASFSTPAPLKRPDRRS